MRLMELVFVMNKDIFKYYYKNSYKNIQYNFYLFSILLAFLIPLDHLLLQCLEVYHQFQLIHN